MEENSNPLHSLLGAVKLGARQRSTDSDDMRASQNI
jgi:hypothetical protein